VPSEKIMENMKTVAYEMKLVKMYFEQHSTFDYPQKIVGITATDIVLWKNYYAESNT